MTPPFRVEHLHQATKIQQRGTAVGVRFSEVRRQLHRRIERTERFGRISLLQVDLAQHVAPNRIFERQPAA